MNAITVILRVNLSVGGRCPPHAYRKMHSSPGAICNYTSLDLTEKYVQILYFQDPTITSVIQNSIIELQLVRMILKRQLLLSDSADDRPILLTCIPHFLQYA